MVRSLAVCLFILYALANTGYAQKQKGDAPLLIKEKEEKASDSTGIVKSGMAVLFEEYADELRGKSVGVVVNHTSRDTSGRHLVDRILELDNVRVAAIFSPEHGYRGDVSAGREIEDDVYPVSGARVYSLYGETRKPTPEMLEEVDLLMYDIQDIGVRYYTYISTMGYAMQAAAEEGIPFWVLDRPNPLTGSQLTGPVLREGHESFVGLYPIPVRYGLTSGELALMIAGEGWLEMPDGFEPRVIRMQGWERDMWYDQTGLPWIAPSPNMPDLATATVYPGLCLVEGTNVSEGRGTDHPFLRIGAPWIDGDALAQQMIIAPLAGVSFNPVQFIPRDLPGRAINPRYEGERCYGIRIRVTDRERFQAVATGVYLLHTIHRMYPEQFQWRASAIDRLYGSDRLRTAIEGGESPGEIIRNWRRPVEEFIKRRQKYSLY